MLKSKMCRGVFKMQMEITVNRKYFKKMKFSLNFGVL